MATSRGFSYVEVLVALAVLGIASSVAFTADAGQLRHVVVAFAETKASRLAAARLETLRDPDIACPLGKREFELRRQQIVGLPHARGHQRVRRLAPGLLEVTVVVSWLPAGALQRRRSELVTWIDREVGR